MDLKKIGPTLLLNECILHMNSGYSGHLGTLSHPWRHSTDQPSSKIHHPSPQGKSTKVNTPYSKVGSGHVSKHSLLGEMGYMVRGIILGHFRLSA